MSFLPLVQRELLVTARKRSNTFGRVLLAAIALGIAAYVAHSSRVSARIGYDLLTAIFFVLMIEAILAGVRYTADCISEEKREGTLGLLFLTNLGGLDVVLGKMASRALAASFNLLAVVPIYSLSLLFGGVSGRQVLGVSLLLVCTSFFSLSVGLAVSSSSWSERGVLSRTVLWIAGVCFVPILAQQAFWRVTGSDWLEWLLYISPIVGGVHATGGQLPRAGWTCAWLGGGALLAIAWSVWQVRRAFTVAGEPVRESREKSLGERLYETALRSRQLQMNPMFWLTIRQMSISRATWFAVLAIFAGVIFRVIAETYGNSRYMTFVLFGSYGLHLFFKFSVAADAARRFYNDQRSGALELLLSTPLPVRYILRGQQLAFRETYLRAVVALAFLNLAWMTHHDTLNDIFVALPCSIILLIHDFHTIRWVGMVNGLKCARYPAAVLKTIGQVVGVPAAIFLAVLFGSNGMTNTGLQGFLFIWTVGCVAYNVVLTRLAKLKLADLRSLASGDKWRPAWVAGGRPVNEPSGAFAPA